MRLLLLFAAIGSLCGAAPMKVGIAQMACAPKLSDNCDKMVRSIHQARLRDCRVAVFPEGALGGAAPRSEDMDAAVDRLRQAARAEGIYVVFGANSTDQAGKPYNWAAAIDPTGREIFRYEKLYDHHKAKMPSVFQIDGVACSAMICADRWLRGVEELPIMQGSRISFELSNNYPVEWVPALQWYWNVPRALRNSVWVVFANSGNAPGFPPEHGHSAVVAPDGKIAAASDDKEQLVVAEIDPDKATRAEAISRRSHPVLEQFWGAGLRILAGEPVAAESPRYTSPEVSVKIAGAQMSCQRGIAANIRKMRAMIRTAAIEGSQLVVFPELAVTGRLERDIRAAGDETLAHAVEELRTAARESAIAVVAGAPRRSAGKLYNSALVIGADGALLTRYDQMVVDRPALFEAGKQAKTMWFRLNGVPAVVTIGRDGLWSEIAEMAAMAGAQIHVHIENNTDSDLPRMQVWANLASYLTFTPTINAAAGGGSAIWDDLNSLQERTAVRLKQWNPDTSIPIFSPFSANCVVKAGAGEKMIYATRKMNSVNRQRSSGMNPQMAPWYALGASLLSAGPGF